MRWQGHIENTHTGQKLLTEKSMTDTHSNEMVCLKTTAAVRPTSSNVYKDLLELHTCTPAQAGVSIRDDVQRGALVPLSEKEHTTVLTSRRQY